MMYSEFLNLTNRKVSYDTYTNKIEPEYMKSELNKQDFCKQYVESTKRVKIEINTNEFNKDKFVKASTFKTALKHLSNMVQGNEDGKVFYISDIMDNYERGLNNWNRIVKENENKPSYCKVSNYELRKLAINESGDIKEKNFYRTVIMPNEYYDYWISGEYYFRMTIELMEDGKAYIDCGYNCFN
jgi:hypothetical protein